MANETPKNMPPWQTKRVLLKTRRSSTAGKEKGLNCQATGLDKAMAKYPRSHKNNNKRLWKDWDKSCAQFWKH